MDRKMTIRKWKEKFERGEFDSSGINTQIDAGWYDWFCKPSSLAKKTTNFYKFIKRINNDFLLDHYYIWFKNNCPTIYGLYDDIRFEIITESEERCGGYFIISEYPKDGSNHGYKYSICTERNDYKDELVTNSLKELMDYINNSLMPQLEKDLKGKI